MQIYGKIKVGGASVTGRHPPAVAVFADAPSTAVFNLGAGRLLSEGGSFKFYRTFQRRWDVSQLARCLKEHGEKAGTPGFAT